jgi:hypothetical protein
MKRIVGASALLMAAIAVVAISYHSGQASDHDDTNNIDREHGLTDHFFFKSPATPTEVSIITYFSGRSLPQRQYFMGLNTRYEQHVTKVANKTADATGKDDFVFRFEATTAPDANGIQQVKLTILKDMAGTLTEAGTVMGATTAFAKSTGNVADLTINTGAAGGVNSKFFIGMRADSFTFDVNRFFEVRAFLARRFFGGPGGIGDPNATLSKNCRGDSFLAILGLPGVTENGAPDHDTINLWNPPSCAPDFTKNYNVMAIVNNVPIADLGGTVFDSWSTISVLQ